MIVCENLIYHFITTMESLLTVHQLQNILKVDRITIYRMLRDGRLKGTKIGQQWRFSPNEIDRVTGSSLEPSEHAPADGSPFFPTHCVQAIQDLFSTVGQIGTLVVDNEGNPLTLESRPCAFCQLIMGSPTSLAGCQASWKAIAHQAGAASSTTQPPEEAIFTCHAGLQYLSAPIVDNGQLIAWFLAGPVNWQAPDPLETAGRVHWLANSYGIDRATLEQAAANIQVIEPARQVELASWPGAAASTVQSILHERISIVDRLQRIADLTQIL